MATITGYTAARMKEIEDNAIIGGSVVGDNLLLTRYNGGQINAGNVRGLIGPQGYAGEASFQIVTSTTRPATPTSGLMIYETDTKQIYSWSGTAWVYRGGTILCTSTTRPTTPFAGLMIYETDTKQVFVWTGTLWMTPGGVMLCTSTTHPTSPFAGQMIYETDTGKFWVYDGVTWNLPKNISGGTLGFVSASWAGSALGPAVADLPGMVVTAIIGASRRIRISVDVFMSHQGAGSWVGTELWEGATYLYRMSYGMDQFDHVSNSVIMTPTAGSHTYKLRGISNGSTFQYGSGTNIPATMLVEDIGGV